MLKSVNGTLITQLFFAVNIRLVFLIHCWPQLNKTCFGINTILKCISDIPIYSESLLSVSRGATGNALWPCYRHVVPWVYFGWNAHWRTSVQWSQWGIWWIALKILFLFSVSDSIIWKLFLGKDVYLPTFIIQVLGQFWTYFIHLKFFVNYVTVSLELWDGKRDLSICQWRRAIN